MEITNEEVINDAKQYARFCNQFANNFAEGSSIVDRLKKLNAQIVKDQHLTGYFKVRMTQAFSHDDQGTPFIDLAAEQKTKDYLAVENEYHVNLDEYNELFRRYRRFYQTSQISELFANGKDIEGPKVENNGNFRYPVVSIRMRYLVRYLEENEQSDFQQACEFANKKMRQLGATDHYTQQLRTSHSRCHIHVASSYFSAAV